VEFPPELKELGAFAFAKCIRLKAITIPDGLRDISRQAFAGCKSVKSLVFGNSSRLTVIGVGAFGGLKALKRVALPAAVESLSESAFAYCTSLRSVLFPPGLQVIGESCFWRCTSLATKIAIPAAVREIRAKAFGRTKVKFAFVQNGAVQIDGTAFSHALRCVVAPPDAESGLLGGEMPADRFCFDGIPLAARLAELVPVGIACAVAISGWYAYKRFAQKRKDLIQEETPLFSKGGRRYLP
jgi:hypothetical protein